MSNHFNIGADEFAYPFIRHSHFIDGITTSAIVTNIAPVLQSNHISNEILTPKNIEFSVPIRNAEMKNVVQNKADKVFSFLIISLIATTSIGCIIFYYIEKKNHINLKKNKNE